MISFCTSCKNRTKYLKKTLEHNLKVVQDTAHDINIVDYNSEDDLDEYMSNFSQHLNLHYHRYSCQTNEWHASKAKNVSHIAANGDIVFNLDCDNFISKQLVFQIETIFSCVPDTIFFNAYKPGVKFNKDNIEYIGDGTGGRIALTKQNFIKLGGYDESFEPMGYQDNDLIARSIAIGLSYIREPNYAGAVLHPKCEGMNIKSSDWEAMDQRNKATSCSNVQNKRLICPTDFALIRDKIEQIF